MPPLIDSVDGVIIGTYADSLPDDDDVAPPAELGVSVKRNGYGRAYPRACGKQCGVSEVRYTESGAWSSPYLARRR